MEICIKEQTSTAAGLMFPLFNRVWGVVQHRILHKITEVNIRDLKTYIQENHFSLSQREFLLGVCVYACSLANVFKRKKKVLAKPNQISREATEQVWKKIGIFIPL